MFALDHPWWLLVLAVMVPSAAIGWRWMSGVPKGRRALAVGMRCVLIGLVALALAGLQRVQESDRVAVIAVLDVSGSIRGFADFGVDDLGEELHAEEGYRGWLAQAGEGRKPDDLLGVVIFDGRASAVGLPARAGVLERIVAGQESTGTDISSAITRARGMLPADVNGRIVLISDGRETMGDLAGVGDSVPIDVVPVRYEISSEVVVESVEVPARALPESVVDARVVVRSAGRSSGVLRVFYDGVAVDLDPGSSGDGLRINVRPGRQVIPVRVRLGAGRVHRVRAVYEPIERIDERGMRVVSGDTSRANNSAGGVTITPGHGRVLLVDGVSNADATGAGAALGTTLGRAGWTLDVIAADDFPADLLTIEQYDLVVLANTPRDALEEADEALIETFTRVFGGGVIFVGGYDALGAGGWRGSDLERILPVKLDVADDVVMPEAAVVIVLDSSGSMRRAVFGSSRSQQTVANEAAGGAIDALDPHDQIGVIAFSDSPRVVVGIGPNDDPEGTRRAVLAIRSSGGTNLGPAMELAKEQLDSIDAKSKHMIVLSDGQSENAEQLPGLAERFGQAGIKISTIAVGDDADEGTLRQIATRSGGVAHRVINPTRLPRVFLKAMRVVRTPLVREEVFTPIVVDANSPAFDADGALPPLGGLVMTERSDDPLVSTPIVSDRGEPVLAHHQVELGRVAVFTSDASQWAAQWIEGPAFDRFWLRLAQWTMRSARDEPGEMGIIVRNGAATIKYTAIGEDGAPIDGLAVEVQVYSPQGEKRSGVLVQGGAGRYEGVVDGLSAGEHVVVARPADNGDPLLPSIAGFEVSGAAEFAHLTADPQALIDVAARTGGRVLSLDDPQSAALFDRRGLTPTRAYTPMWPVLIVLLLLVFLGDIAARRVAWDRWVTQARDETIAVTRAVRTNTERLRSSKRTAPAAGTIEIEQPRRKRSKKPVAVEKPAEPVSEEPDAEENPLLAAKRRARSQMDEE